MQTKLQKQLKSPQKRGNLMDWQMSDKLDIQYFQVDVLAQHTSFLCFFMSVVAFDCVHS